MEHIQTDTDFRRFIKTIGPWFEGMAIFVVHGAVSVIVGESVTPIVMDGITARMDDAFYLAELFDSDVSSTVDIGGFQIKFGASFGQ